MNVFGKERLDQLLKLCFPLWDIEMKHDRIANSHLRLSILDVLGHRS